MAARRAHNPKVTGSSPVPAIQKNCDIKTNAQFFIIYNDAVRIPEAPKRVPINKNIFEDDDL